MGERWGIANARVSTRFPRLLATAGDVSEEFVSTIESAIIALPPRLRFSLVESDCRIAGVRRLIDVSEFAAVGAASARGAYKGGIVFVAQESMQGDRWMLNMMPQGTMRHEIGHHVNKQLGRVSLMSEEAEFVAAHIRDVDVMPESLRAQLAPLLNRDRLAREELFAEVFAIRLGGPADTAVARLIQLAFPEVLGVMGLRR